LKTFISDSAYADFESIIDYYTGKGVLHIGEQFVTSIIQHIETIAANPDIGRKVPEFNTKNSIKDRHLRWHNDACPYYFFKPIN